MKDPTTRRFKRRTFLAGIGASAAALSTPAIIRGASAAQRFDGKEIRILTWTDVTGKAAVRNIAQPFQQMTGAKVVADLTGATSEMVAKVKASEANPQYDVVILSGVGAVELAQAGLLQQPTEELLPNIQRVVPSLRYGADGLGVGYLLWTDGLIYSTRTFKQAPDTWRVLWDSQYQLFLPPPQWVEAMVLTVMAARLAGSDVKNPEPGFELLEELRDRVIILGESPQQVAELFRSGTIQVGGAYAPMLMPDFIRNPEYHMSGALGMKEGFFYDLQFMIIPEGHPGDDEVTHAFINYALDAGVQAKMAEDVWYGPINQDTKLSEKARQSPYIVSPDTVREKGISSFSDYLASVRADWIRRYTEIFGA
ncbi:MAG: extracellular solute-binding protein [Gammaproteobacteria bacterium]|nr:extracellular solute-binding protein [Gammaproteobacteria bacterium]NIR82025.1 extracellular solute-binding protein [Gammaproteobacteria bacterium]NIR89253.1 extracellular solute-binding protein [Gammaproteobacteria bacterium]NIU03135.1 extracellular solute-binding protein [Gammaproteobacteria bacterium]NIV50651.1 extracellular solute-binding protein [Gammaproteobacteria bacterium]